MMEWIRKALANSRKEEEESEAEEGEACWFYGAPLSAVFAESIHFFPCVGTCLASVHE